MPSSYTIGDRFERFVAELVAGGSYSSASEVIRAGLRLLDDQERLREARLEALRGDIGVGIDDLENGRFVELTTGEDVDTFFDNVAARGRRRLRAQRSE